MKSGKAAGTSGIITGMLKATGEVGIQILRQLGDLVLSTGVIPQDWKESIIFNL